MIITAETKDSGRKRGERQGGDYEPKNKTSFFVISKKRRKNEGKMCFGV